jgi:Mg/Co/Ni transporter MgtE
VEPTDIDATLDKIRAALESPHVDEAIAARIRLRPADRAEAFADLPEDDQAALLPRLDISTTADMLEELQDPEAADAARILTPDRLADSVGIDPTVMSAPLLATLVDATGLVIYLTIAAALLPQI